MHRTRLALVSLAAASLIGCSDDGSTAPAAAGATPTKSVAAATPAMRAFGGSLGDATGQFVASAGDVAAQTMLRGTLKDLSTHLDEGDTEGALRDIARARRLIKDAGEEAAFELAPIGLALDQAEQVLKGETPGGEPQGETPATPR